MIRVKIFCNDEYIDCIDIDGYDIYDQLYSLAYHPMVCMVKPSNIIRVCYSFMSLHFFPTYLHPDEQICNISMIEYTPLLMNFITAN